MFDVKRFDVYRKLPKDLTQPTTAGAVISILSTCFIFFLLISEGLAFMQDELVSELYVDDGAMSGSPRPSSSSTFSPPAMKAAVTRPIRKSFVPPYKGKKKCDCEKCLMPKCGACYNCLNKRKTRLVYSTYFISQ